jgi:exopolysaccharide production protein ExoZ
VKQRGVALGMLPKTFVSVQFLRFIAALLVVLSHANYLADFYFPKSNSALVTYLFDFGHCGVHIFFVISGFVMVYSTFSPSPAMSPRDFLLRRFFRIYPIYWLYALAYLAWKVSESGQPLPLSDVLRSLALWPGYSSLLIGQGWTLSYEVYFYVCFAVAIPLGVNRGLIGLFTFFVVSIALRRLLPIDQPVADVISNPILLEFIAGCGIAAAVLNEINISLTTCRLAIGSAVMSFVAGLYFGYDKIPTVIGWGIPSALLVGGFALAELKGQTINEKLAALGDSSYSLYLIHAILLNGMFYTSSHFISGFGLLERLVLCALFSVVCCLIAIVCFNLIERRLYRLRVVRIKPAPVT